MPAATLTGIARSRADIHRRGDWHQAFHCWIVRDGPRREELVLQQRSLAKDTFPGCWDAAAAGHWRFGETAAQAAREIEEELGIAVPFDALHWVGREAIDREHPNGLVDREHHQVYVLHWPAPLTSYRPDAGGGRHARRVPTGRANSRSPGVSRPRSTPRKRSGSSRTAVCGQCRRR